MENAPRGRRSSRQLRARGGATATAAATALARAPASPSAVAFGVARRRHRGGRRLVARAHGRRAPARAPSSSPDGFGVESGPRRPRRAAGVTRSFYADDAGARRVAPASARSKADDWASARRAGQRVDRRADDDGPGSRVVEARTDIVVLADVGHLADGHGDRGPTPPPRARDGAVRRRRRRAEVRFGARDATRAERASGMLRLRGPVRARERSSARSAYCVWTDARTVKVTFDATATIVPIRRRSPRPHGRERGLPARRRRALRRDRSRRC